MHFAVLGCHHEKRCLSFHSFTFGITSYFLFCEGNLSLKVTKEDLARHFSLDTTPYLRSSSWIELAVERPGASQGFGFINVPEHLAGMFLEAGQLCLIFKQQTAVSFIKQYCK